MQLKYICKFPKVIKGTTQIGKQTLRLCIHFIFEMFSLLPNLTLSYIDYNRQTDLRSLLTRDKNVLKQLTEPNGVYFVKGKTLYSICESYIWNNLSDRNMNSFFSDSDYYPAESQTGLLDETVELFKFQPLRLLQT